MAPTTRRLKTAKNAVATEQKQHDKKKKTPDLGEADVDTSANVDDDGPPLPFGSRVVIIIVTSYFAEKIWRHRSLVSAAWYSDKQTALEQAMITGFEYTIVMGLLFFIGIIVSVVTVSIQKKITG